MLRGDARRRVQLEQLNAADDARRLERELVRLRASIAEIRKMNRHEQAVRMPWVLARIPHVANEASLARARAARLQDELEAGRT